MGPIENPRSLNLIQWTLQFFALGLIFASSYHQAASLSIVLLILLWEVIPAKWKTRMQVQYQLKIRKPKHKLLTEEEYLDQSQEKDFTFTFTSSVWSLDLLQEQSDPPCAGTILSF